MKYYNHIEHYKIDAESYDFFERDKFIIQEDRRRYQAIYALLDVKEKQNILDIGSGGSRALESFKSGEYYPLDISTLNLKKLQEKFSKKISPVSGDIYNLPFNPGTFDNIILSEVLEHLDNPEEALKEVHRILKSNGSLVISVPYKEKLTYQICIHCNQLTPTNSHLHSFDENKLQNLLKPVGFNIIKSIKCINKISNRLHLNILLKKLPYKYWRIMDGLFNYIVDKPASLIILCKK